MAEFSQASLEQLHSWAVWSLVRGTYTSPDGEVFERTFVKSPGAVAVVPIINQLDNPSVILLRQFRPALGRMIFEIPAGMRDVPGESLESTALRELEEETGFRCGSLLHLGRLASAPGITNSEVHIFLGTDLQDGMIDRHGPEENHMETTVIELSTAVQMVRDGDIDDSKTMIGLLLANEALRGGKE